MKLTMKRLVTAQNIVITVSMTNVLTKPPSITVQNIYHFHLTKVEIVSVMKVTIIKPNGGSTQCQATMMFGKRLEINQFNVKSTIVSNARLKMFVKSVMKVL